MCCWIVEEAEQIAQMLENNKCVYMPYLGKNDHLADIKHVTLLDLETIVLKETEISSMFPKQIGKMFLPDDEDEIEKIKYEEKLPIRLDGHTNLLRV